MGSFLERTTTADLFIRRMKEFYWTSDLIRQYGIVNHEYGYETHVRETVRELLRYRHSITASFIKYAPDSLLCGRDKETLLEYKVTNTPRYTYGERQWDCGQIEAEALDHYLRLCGMGVEVIILLYCPYHSFPILCGKPDREWIISQRQKSNRSTGSGTPYYNLDLCKMKHFDQFMEEYFGIPAPASRPLLGELLKTARNDRELQTHHARGSGYGDGSHQTGFNWEI